MPTTTEQAPDTRSLEDQVQELAAEEKQLKARLDSSQIATVVAAIVALIASIVAVAVALSHTGNTTKYVTSTPASSGSASSASHQSGSAKGAGGAGMTGGGTTATNRTINVQLGEMFARPSSSSISAGKVTFVARNTGQLPHELMVERMPIKMDAPGKPTESAALGMIENMLPGHTGKLTAKLTPGTYELFCNVPGHYAAGQHTMFTVTK